MLCDHRQSLAELNNNNNSEVQIFIFFFFYIVFMLYTIQPTNYIRDTSKILQTVYFSTKT